MAETLQTLPQSGLDFLKLVQGASNYYISSWTCLPPAQRDVEVPRTLCSSLWQITSRGTRKARETGVPAPPFSCVWPRLSSLDSQSLFWTPLLAWRFTVTTAWPLCPGTISHFLCFWVFLWYSGYWRWHSPFLRLDEGWQHPCWQWYCTRHPEQPTCPLTSSELRQVSSLEPDTH